MLIITYSTDHYMPDRVDTFLWEFYERKTYFFFMCRTSSNSLSSDLLIEAITGSSIPVEGQRNYDDPIIRYRSQNDQNSL